MKQCHTFMGSIKREEPPFALCPHGDREPTAVASSVLQNGRAGLQRLLAAALCVLTTLSTSGAEEQSESLRRDRFKNGDATLLAFAPIASAVRNSIVKVDLNGNTVALAAVIGPGGLAITKASEIKPGKLTCWLAGGKEVGAELILMDETNDVALLRVDASGLKPIEWAAGQTFVGQWGVTPGIESVAQAVGIISVPPRKILPPRALVGVELDQAASTAKVVRVMGGMGAEKAGIKPGDSIVKINGKTVENSQAMMGMLRGFREGQAVDLAVRRDEELIQMNIVLMSPKPDPSERRFDRQSVMNRLGGKLSARAEGFDMAIQHDTVLQPWQCGGPLMNLDGKAIGLNIARAGRVASYALPSELVKQIIQDLTGRAQIPFNTHKNIKVRK